MKRFIALVLSLVMALSLCAPAWATEGGVEQAATGGAVEVATQEALKEAIAAGEKNIIVKDATLNETLKLGSDVNVTFVNCKINGNNAWGYVNNATFEVCTFDSGAANAAIHFDRLYGDLVVNKCIFTSGKVQIGNGGDATATFNNCEFAETATTSIWDEKGMRVYCPTEFNGCEFNNRVVLAGSNGLPVTFNSCTMNGGTPVYYVNNSDGIIRGGNVPSVAIDVTKDAEGKYTGGFFNTNPTGNVADGYKVTESNGTYTVGEAPNVATADGVPYKTLQAALNAGGNVVLLATVDLSAMVTVAKDVVLNLNGYTVTSTTDVFKVTADSGVALTINGPGKVVSGSGDSDCAIWSVGNGSAANTITLDKVTIEAAMCGVYHNGNKFGATVNVKNGTSITSKDTAVFLSGDTPWGDNKNNLTITGSSITGAVSAVEVKHGNVTVDNSTLTAKASTASLVSNGNGSCSTGYALALTNSGTNKTTGAVTINSGYFKGAVGIKDASDASSFTIKNGYFSVAPSDDYVAEGKVVVSSDKYAGYPYTIGTKKTDVEVVVAAPEVAVNNKLTGEDKTAAEAIAAEGGVEICDDALTAQATTVANADKTKVTDEIEERLEGVLDKGVAKTEVVIVVKPYYDVTVKDVDLSGTTPTIKLDITPMYQKVATTQEVLDSGEELVATEGAGDERNAIAVGRPTEMKVTGAVDITVVIPESIGATNETLYVTHKTSTGKTYVYEATVAEDNGVYTATFTNNHGFSSFTVSGTNNIVASIGDDNYTSLQDALDSVKDGETIVVKKSDVDGETVKGSKKYEFTVALASGVDNVTIENNGTETTLGNGGSGTFEVAKDTSGSSGGKIPGSGSSGSSSSGSSSSDKVTSADTFDAGIAMYVGMSVLAATGSAVVIGKKKD